MTPEKTNVERLAGVVLSFLWVCGFIFCVQIAADWWNTGSVFPRDDTDSADKRSRLDLRTDYRTGCQYLVAGGGITPRLDQHGSPLCEAKR